jgi:membrane associated rhomboid family serine protease
MAYNRDTYRSDVGLAGRITPGIKWIIIANVGVFVLQMIGRLSQRGGIEPIFGLTPAVTFGDLWLWQLVTYMFLHSTGWLSHILLNMLMLWMFGTEVERAWGTRAFLRYYFVCGVGAALVTSLLFWESTTIGASGAVFGVMLAYAMMFPNRQILFWFIFPMRAVSFVLLCAGIELFSLLSLQDGVAHIAHLGGMAFGWLYLKRAWRLRQFLGDLKWRLRRRRFKVVDREDRRYPFH